MKCVFCPKCGTHTTSRDLGDEGLVPYCPQCQTVLFDSPTPAILAVVIDEAGRVVLLRQPHVTNTHWVLVAGYIKSGETAETAAQREVREETGLLVYDLRYIASFYHDKTDNLMLGYLVRARGSLVTESPEVERAESFDPAEAEALLRPGSVAHKLFLQTSALIDHEQVP